MNTFWPRSFWFLKWIWLITIQLLMRLLWKHATRKRIVTELIWTVFSLSHRLLVPLLGQVWLCLRMISAISQSIALSFTSFCSFQCWDRLCGCKIILNSKNKRIITTPSASKNKKGCLTIRIFQRLIQTLPQSITASFNQTPQVMTLLLLPL